MEYTTQMDAARKGIITREMEIVAQKEGKTAREIMDLVACGKVVIPANKNHKSLDPEGIGQGLRTKINVNIGISRDCFNFDAEIEKAKKAIELKADSIMDLSSYGKTRQFRQKLIEISPAMIGTVPIYSAVGHYDKDIGEITAREFIDIVEMHARDGVDFMTIHAGVNKETVRRFKNNPRLTNIVSRGGSIIFSWMQLTGNENPFYEYFDDILDIFAKYDVTISLGDAFRPGSIHDSTDASQIEELIILGELTKRAWKKNVQVMIEGPGHMPINEIAANVLLAKKLCHGAPFYVLGPIVTDIAPGYDHITSAIGGAVAAASGADFLCYVTPAEHLRLPTLEDMKEGIIAAKIAAHAADIAKGIKGAKEWDDRMSQARRNLDWEEMFRLAIDSEKPRQYRMESTPEQEDTCTMCGRMCAVRNMNRILKGENVSLI
ncbi:phosphomethylpyrimidine synthase ThiC [Caldicoprobacter algeriensis]|uniref:phosphomethylpyrimidine synthase ThiC n=1 Tax=Caldicoprobacter algeriensis TaxID=699281 RepID=UPI00207A8CBB|nr:phosphomethylpyrimidine synthase ThiC [Caldicoprobacter algeriensis]MCM8900170.1 phosphomethylpyrimidine synthase ThiC [Caldicoprobacter algeriensis]